MEEVTQMDISTADFVSCSCPLCSSGDQLGSDTVRNSSHTPIIVEVQGDPELSYWSFDTPCSGLRRILKS